MERMRKMRNKPKVLASANKTFVIETQPFLVALAEREEAVRSGKLTTIIFIRDKNAKGQVRTKTSLQTLMKW